MTRCPYCQSETECSSNSCRLSTDAAVDPASIHRLWDVTGTDEPRPSVPVWAWSSHHYDFGDV